MAGGSNYVRFSDILAPTWSLTAGTAAAGSPVTQLGSIRPWSPKTFQATSGTITARATFVGSTTIDAIALIGPHSLAGVTINVSSGAGLSTTIVPGANALSGRAQNYLKDVRGLSGIASTTFDFAISGAGSNVIINKILLVKSGGLRTAVTQYSLTHGIRFLNDILETEKDVPLVYETRVHRRPASAEVKLETQRAEIFALYESALGKARPWLLQVDPTDPDVMLARFDDATLTALRKYPAVSPMKIGVEEYGLGPTLP